MSTVIVFGPTGNIGSVAARTAEACGATVWLGMRDTSKAIPTLTAEQEKSGRFERVEADLTNPDTLTAAVKKSGAKRAFIYLAHGSKDHMKASLQALKSAGVEYIVFLSSFTINTPSPADIEPSELIPYVHAQVELSLDSVFGHDNFVAVRPGAFATNILPYVSGIKAGHVSCPGANFDMDAVTFTDMGEVSGILLASGPKNGQHEVYVYGPERMTQGEAIKRAGKVVWGNDVEVQDLTGQDALDAYAKAGFPKPFADYMARVISRTDEEADANHVRYEEGVKNVELYTGHPATKFEDFVEAHKSLFGA
ncbi:hypothetical protein BAUCODRAFT_33513 [Baudoinia panamericana UAMH 10762]|uniref:NmrA-like domain-containing protein n=1 Tax=Baudoinia panamericana (strain UAMH 10762) TaxID=717646 RepID=M2LP67_BAUPA|nr:uncharacterized protein BAUCODRAFT_33513 [Baudoinia panamericana UAMH 10762]EMC96172.1 hypothetical protein BAUCODRAFT_33513 [Baudoinia panamericana UAMH 10762]